MYSNRDVFQLTPGSLHARHLRVTFSGPFGTESSVDESKLWNDPTLFVENAVKVSPDKVGKKYPPVTACIYCGAKKFSTNLDRPLSDEHIVAEGLGGNLILPESSCGECAKKTGRIEGAVLRNMMWTPRLRLGIRGKSRKRDMANFLFKATVDGKELPLKLPLADHPSILLLLAYQAPRVLSFRSPDADDVAGFWVHTLGSPTAAIQLGAEKISSDGFDTVRFNQMLAKIAHSFAVAEVGPSNFKPLLPEFILRAFGKAEQYRECFNFVGGDPSHFAPAEELHTLGYETVKFGPPTYLTVVIRLFANLGAPAFRVVVGEA
jgi:hypothetical protein